VRILDSKNRRCRADDAAAKLMDQLMRLRWRISRPCRWLPATNASHSNSIRGWCRARHYNRTVFSGDRPARRAGHGGAGRALHGLIEQLAASRAPQPGFAMGIERLLSLMERAGTPLATRWPDAYIVSRRRCGTGVRLAGRERVAQRRARSRAALRRRQLQVADEKADASRARYAVIIGDDEAVAQQVTLNSARHRRTDRVEVTLAIEYLKTQQFKRHSTMAPTSRRTGTAGRTEGLVETLGQSGDARPGRGDRGGGGWRYWQNHTVTQSLEAATVYEKLTQSLAANDAKGAREAGSMLIDQYKNTPMRRVRRCCLPS